MVDSSQLGSTDIQNAIDIHLPRDSRFTPSLPTIEDVSHFQQLRQEEILTRNREVATFIFSRIFLARLIIFDQFVRVMIQIEGHDKDANFYREKWLYIQLRPLLVFPEMDVFDCLSTVLVKHAPNAYVEQQTQALLASLQTNLRVQPEKKGIASYTSAVPRTPIFCVLDEAQYAASSYSSAFRSASNPMSPRPVLREIVRSWEMQGAAHGVFMVVAGTGISKDVVDQAMASAIMKDSRYRWSSDTGAFDSEEQQEAYLRKYLPSDLLASQSGKRLLQRVCHWLRGRYVIDCVNLDSLAGFCD